MKKYALLAVLFVGFFPSKSFARDTQVWVTEQVEGAVSENTIVKFEEEERLGGSASNLYYHHTDIGVGYKIGKGLSVTAQLRNVFENKSGTWQHELRPHANVTYATTLCGFAVSDRGRFEYRDRETKDGFRFRNLLTISAPSVWNMYDFRPYIADELFVDINQGDFVRNRLYSGVTRPIAGQLSVDLYYMWQINKGGAEWENIDVAGVKLKLAFK
jgi:hypothetical protein